MLLKKYSINYVIANVWILLSDNATFQKIHLSLPLRDAQPADDNFKGDLFNDKICISAAYMFEYHYVASRFWWAITILEIDCESNTQHITMTS